HIVGIVLVEPPEEQNAVGVHVSYDDVKTPLCLLDEHVVMQDVAQTDQTVEPISAPFIRPASLGIVETDAGHGVIGGPRSLELLIVLVHVPRVAIHGCQAPVAEPTS